MSDLFSNQIHHIAIISSDYPRSKHFYNQILGFEIIREAYRQERQSYKLDLKINDYSAIELFSFPVTPPRPSTPEACGLRHLAFCVDNLEVVINRLQSFAVEVEEIRIDEFTGCRFTFFKDPDGLPLEIYELTRSQ